MQKKMMENRRRAARSSAAAIAMLAALQASHSAFGGSPLVWIGDTGDNLNTTNAFSLNSNWSLTTGTGTPTGISGNNLIFATSDSGGSTAYSGQVLPTSGDLSGTLATGGTAGGNGNPLSVNFGYKTTSNIVFTLGQSLVVGNAGDNINFQSNALPVISVASDTTGSQTIQANIGLAAAGTFSDAESATSGSLTISGTIGDGGSGYALTKTGVGVIALSGSNTYSGGTVVSAGTLVAANPHALGSTSSDTVSLAGGTLDLAVDSGLIAYNTTVTATSTIASDKATTSSSGVTQTLGTLSIGSVTLNGIAGANVSGGSPAVAFGAVTLSTATGGGTTTFDPTTASLSLASVASSAGTSVTNTLDLDGTISGNTIGGAISNSTNGTTAVTKTNSSTWILSGSSTYSGGTTISAGTLVVGNAYALGTSSSPVSLGGGTLDLAVDSGLNAYNTTVTGTSTIASDKATASSAGVTQTLGSLSIGSVTLNATAGANVSGGSPAVAFGAVTLSTPGGATTTFDPTTASISLASVTSSVSNARTDTLDLDGTASGNSIVGGITNNPSTTGKTAVAKTNSSIWILSGSSAYTGGTIVSAGTLVAGVSNSGTTTGAFGPKADGVTLGDANTAANNSSPSLLIGGAYTVANPITIANQSTSGTYSIGGNTDASSTFSGQITLNQGLTVVSQAVAANNDAVSITGGISSAGGSQTVTFVGPGAAYVGTNGITNGSGTVAVKVSDGIANLAASSSYSGGTVVSAGTLIAGVSSASNGSSGAFGPSADGVTLGDANTTTNNSSPSLLIGGAFTVANPITVANQSTSGTYAIGGSTDANSTFSGQITLNQCLTVVSQALAANSHALSITGGISSAGGAQTVTFAGPGVAAVGTNGITDGSGTLSVKVTGGIAEFTASNSYSGSTTLTGGTLAVSGSIASGTVTLNAASSSPTLALTSITALSSSANIVVDTGSGTPSIILDLASSGTTPVPTQAVNTFVINGSYLAPGVYSLSNEPSLDSTLFASDGSGDVGSITVSAPEPGALSVLGIGAFGLLARRRRRSQRVVCPN